MKNEQTLKLNTPGGNEGSLPVFVVLKRMIGNMPVEHYCEQA